METTLKRLGIVVMFLLPSVCFANGPKYSHQDNFDQMEFENVYHDIGAIPAASTSVPDPLFVSSAVVTNLTANIKGDATGGAAAAGYVGEVVTSFAQSVSGNTGYTLKDITSVVLTPGDWMVGGSAYFSTGGSSAITAMDIVISAISGTSTADFVSGDNGFYGWGANSINAFQALSIAPRHYLLSSSTTLYLKGEASTGGAAFNMNGRITAWRIR